MKYTVLKLHNAFEGGRCTDFALNSCHKKSNQSDFEDALLQ